MQSVLLIESDPVWRLAMRRSLSHLAGVEIIGAASFSEAICLVAVERPGMIIFDVDVKESFDVQAMGNLNLPRLNVPLVCISENAEAFQRLADKRPGVTLLQKPISLKQLESIVSTALGVEREPSPFGVVEYVQLACLGKHSVMIEVYGELGADIGQILVHEGEIWSVRTRNATGEDALYELSMLEHVQFRCRLLPESDQRQEMSDRWEKLLIEAARRRDERQRMSG